MATTQKKKQQPKTVITIARQTASGGSYIARSLARTLGFRYVDRDILYGAAKALGVAESELSGREERISTFFENLMRSYCCGTPEIAYVPLSKRPVHDQELFDAEAKIMREIADRSDAVIVGRGGYHILAGHPGLVKVFLHAPVDFRLERLRTVRSFADPEQARAEIEASDREKEKFMCEMTGVSWADARNYHLSLDTSMIDFQTAEKMIVQLAARVQNRGTL